jgi:enterochelin esterase-like enzyme
MIHLVKLIERRFPNQADRMIRVLVAVSIGGVAAGILLLLFG